MARRARHLDPRTLAERLGGIAELEPGIEQALIAAQRGDIFKNRRPNVCSVCNDRPPMPAFGDCGNSECPWAPKDPAEEAHNDIMKSSTTTWEEWR